MLLGNRYIHATVTNSLKCDFVLFEIIFFYLVLFMKIPFYTKNGNEMTQDQT